MMIRSLVCMVAMLAFAGVAEAGAVSTSDLFPEDTTPTDYLLTPGQTRYVFVESVETVVLDSISAFGEPVGGNASRDFRFQLFHTDANWDTPNGNEDRLFYEQVFFTDIGRATYTVDTDHFFGTPTTILLEAGERYRLSFQVANTQWNLPQHDVADPTNPFGTQDERFLVHGAGHHVAYSSRDKLFTFSLTTSTVPLPASAWLGLGLLGVLGLARRRKRR